MSISGKILPEEIPLAPPKELIKGMIQKRREINMNNIVGSCDILFLCFDSLRYDVALSEQQNGTTPVLNRYGVWEKRGAPGNFTYPSHHAMFAGFLPSPPEPVPMNKRNMLFFPQGTGLGRVSPPNAFSFRQPTFIEALSEKGYRTICIGGVSFFSGRGALGKVFPDMFEQSFWNPSFGCTVKESPDNQLKKAVSLLAEIGVDQRVMMYINFCAIHYPNYFYLNGEKRILSILMP